jgi:mycothiol maleylpyruvate isomerase-like protein
MMADGSSETSLEAGFIELASIVRALHGDWAAPAGDGYGDWSCKDLLAHLSSSEAALARVVASSTDPPRPDAEPFDADRWNASQVRRRKDASDQDLLNEFDLGTTRLVETLTGMDLKQPVNAGAYAGRPLGEAMQNMLEHQRRHLDDLRTALHAHPEA